MEEGKKKSDVIFSIKCITSWTVSNNCSFELQDEHADIRVQLWPFMFAKCAAEWVPDLVSMGAMALVWPSQKFLRSPTVPVGILSYQLAYGCLRSQRHLRWYEFLSHSQTIQTGFLAHHLYGTFPFSMPFLSLSLLLLFLNIKNNKYIPVEFGLASPSMCSNSYHPFYVLMTAGFTSMKEILNTSPTPILF